MKKIILFSTILMSSCVSWAAGYQLQEYSVTGLGRSMAGVGVMGDDYSAPAFNPAGMSFNEQSGAQLGFIGVDLRSKVKGSQTTALPITSQRGQDYTHIFRLLPHAFGQYNLNDRASLGVGLYTPFGLATDYRNNWYAAAQGEYSAITAVDLTPSLSYKITDAIALGVGVNLQYTSAHLTGGTFDGGWTDMRADDMGVGYMAGLTFQPWKTTRFGLSYRSKVTHKLQGDNKMMGGKFSSALTGKHDVYAKITTPETVIFSAAQDIGQNWTLSGTARWTRWSQFHDLDIYQKDFGQLSSVHEHWRNTWYFAGGADYKFCKNLTFRFGTAVDQTSIKSPEFRTVRIPDQRRIWTSVGASYQKNNWQVDVGYAHLFIRQAHGAAVTGTGAKSVAVQSSWRTSSNILGMQFQYKF